MLEKMVRNKDKQRIGIMGGTFDPIHYGHLVLAEEVRHCLKLDRIIFIPNGTAPHKKAKGVTNASLRFEMVRRAISDNPYFEISDMEIIKEGTSYTVHTLKALKEQLGKTAELFFITGADTLLDLHNWYAFEEVIALCTFVGATRPGYVPDVLKIEAQRLKEAYQAKIELVAIPGLSISSTEIRQRVARGDTIRYLVPRNVETFILEEGIYGPSA